MYYKCKRCDYKCNMKGDMNKHLLRKKKCDHLTPESMKYTEEEIINISNEPIYDDDDNKKKCIQCKKCSKLFTLANNMEHHMKTSCKGKKEDEKLNNNNSINIENIENVENLTNIENIYIENINISPTININLVGFDEKWNIDHIDENLKNTILMCNHKYTELLKETLENILNLNVIIDTNSEKGFVYNKGKKQFEKMDKNKIIEETVLKLKTQLLESTNRINKINSRFTIERPIINKINEDIRAKYDNYKYAEGEKKDDINEKFINIFENNKNKSLGNYEKINNSSSGF